MCMASYWILASSGRIGTGPHDRRSFSSGVIMFPLPLMIVETQRYPPSTPACALDQLPLST